MARNHRSRTLPRRGCSTSFQCLGWGWPGITAHVHSALIESSGPRTVPAGDGQESPLTYTRELVVRSKPLPTRLGMARNHRSRTLQATGEACHPFRWGWPGITAHVHLISAQGPLLSTQSWGWPGITAHVHLSNNPRRAHGSMQTAGDGQESPLTYTTRIATSAIHACSAGDGQESPLTYTV
jgi:hypothetical protein